MNDYNDPNKKKISEQSVPLAVVTNADARTFDM